jgi:hypothetical protein
MGPVCAKRAAPAPSHDRDLFGYEIELAARAATVRLLVQIESAALDARMAVRDAARAARVRLGVWS